MREPDFNALTSELLKKGIKPRHAYRAVNELRDHYDDLLDAAVDEGATSRQARSRAARELGKSDDFVAEMASHPELKSWAFRFPRVAVIVYPLACLAVLPGIPVFVGLAHRTAVMRWGTSLIGGGLITAGMLLILQLSIILG